MKTPLILLAALCLQVALSAQTASGVSPRKPHDLIYGEQDIRLVQDDRDLPDLPTDRGIVDFLGWGCDGVSGEDRAPCVNGLDARMRPGKSFSSVMYQEVHSMSDLREITKTDFTTSKKSGFLLWSTSSKIKSTFESMVKISNESLTIVGKLEYWHGSPMVTNLDGLTVSDKIREMYRNNYRKFHQEYGDGFITKVDLGESMYFICQATLSSSCKYTKSEIHGAMRAKFFGIIGQNKDNGQVKELEEKLAASSFYFKAFSTGSAFVPQLVSNKDEFNALVAKFQQHVKEKEAQANYSVLRSYSTPYAYVVEKTEDPVIAANIEKLMKWYDLRDKIQSVREYYEFSDQTVVKACDAALDVFQEESHKCRSKHTEAREPKIEEYWDLQLKWLEMCSVLMVETYGTIGLSYLPGPHWVTCPAVEMDRDFLSEARKLEWKIPTRQPAGLDTQRIYWNNNGGIVEIEGSPRIIFSSILSTDEFEVQKNSVDPGVAHPIGYVFKKPLPGTMPLWRVNGTCHITTTPGGSLKYIRRGGRYFTDEKSADSWISNPEGYCVLYTKTVPYTTLWLNFANSNKSLLGYVINVKK